MTKLYYLYHTYAYIFVCVQHCLLILQASYQNMVCQSTSTSSIYNSFTHIPFTSLWSVLNVTLLGLRRFQVSAFLHVFQYKFCTHFLSPPFTLYKHRSHLDITTITIQVDLYRSRIFLLHIFQNYPITSFLLLHSKHFKDNDSKVLVMYILVESNIPLMTIT